MWLCVFGLEQAHSSILSDPLQIPSGPITRARTKRFKEALNGLVQDIWPNHNSIQSKSKLKHMYTLIWTKDGGEKGVLGQSHLNWCHWAINYTWVGWNYAQLCYFGLKECFCDQVMYLDKFRVE